MVLTEVFCFLLFFFSGESCIFLLSRLNTFRHPFLTKFGIVLNHHEPECPAKKMGILCLKSRSQSGDIIEI